MKTNITLFLPGLLPEMCDEVEDQLIHVDLSTITALSTFLSRATAVPAPYTIEQTIKMLFSGLPEGNIPAGALGALNYELNAQDKFWCRIDPVHCEINHKGGYVVGNQHLALTPQENLSIVTQLNDFLQIDGMQIIAANTYEWFCILKNKTEITTNDLLHALRKNMALILPSGPDQDYWRRLMTECQMLLKNHAVNVLRTQQQKPLISSIWIWGLGALPTQIKTDYDLLFCTESTMRGLAKAANIPVQDLPWVFNKDCLKTQKVLIADLRCALFLKHLDIQKWYQLLCHYEKNWFEPLLKALGDGLLDSCSLYCAQGRAYHLSKKQLNYFWRRKKPLKYFILSTQ